MGTQTARIADQLRLQTEEPSSKEMARFGPGHEPGPNRHPSTLLRGGAKMTRLLPPPPPPNPPGWLLPLPHPVPGVALGALRVVKW